MSGRRYLVDTSVFARLTKPIVASAVGPLVAEGRLLLCAPVAFELGFAARDPADYQRLSERLDALPPSRRPMPTIGARWRSRRSSRRAASIGLCRSSTRS